MFEKRISSPDRYKILKDFARENRANMTEAENLLWEHLRNRQLGHQFLRQQPISDFIVDFVSRDEGLIIEVDGAYHSEPRQERDDAARQHILESLGYHLFRFSNEEVLFDTERVLEQIKNYFE